MLLSSTPSHPPPNLDPTEKLPSLGQERGWGAAPQSQALLLQTTKVWVSAKHPGIQSSLWEMSQFSSPVAPSSPVWPPLWTEVTVTEWAALCSCLQELRREAPWSFPESPPFAT